MTNYELLIDKCRKELELVKSEILSSSPSRILCDAYVYYCKADIVVVLEEDSIFQSFTDEEYGRLLAEENTLDAIYRTYMKLDRHPLDYAEEAIKLTLLRGGEKA